MLLLALMLILTARAEDGSQLWLRYQSVNKATVTGGKCTAAEELRQYYNGEAVTLALDQTMPNEAYRIDGKDREAVLQTQDPEPLGQPRQQH